MDQACRRVKAGRSCQGPEEDMNHLSIFYDSHKRTMQAAAQKVRDRFR